MNHEGKQFSEHLLAGLDETPTWLSVLQFFVREGEETRFEEDMDEAYELARKQPGYLWGHYGRSMVDGRYFVISEWQTYEEMKAFEHEARHEQIQDESEKRYAPGRDAENRKFVAWYRYDKPRKSWTK